VNGPKLTSSEQAHTLAALRHLRGRVGTWRTLAKALGFEPCSLRNVRKGFKAPSIAMAYRVSRVAGVAFDDVVAGRFMVPRGGKDVES
jgi:transcriptional regulator with XRE-family HTH domain